MANTNISLNYYELSLISGLVNHHFSYSKNTFEEQTKGKNLYNKLQNAMSRIEKIERKIY